MTRHIAYFIENIVRPFLKELDDLLGKCEHLKISSEDLSVYLSNVLAYGVVKTLIWAGVICFLAVLFFIGFCFGLKS
jgi:hypothetical protein